jgi:hypothetical protein
MLKKTKKKLLIMLIIVFVISALLFVYLNFVYAPNCQNYECWQKYMTTCQKASFINEQTEASWGYEIKGKTDNQCNIEVTLLLAKKGELGISEIVGDKMICSYDIGTATYAEKDLSACHGLLKEELQTLIINKLHAYILEHLGQVAEGIEKAI